jgi:polyisoprenoid-binding protein YceI
MSFSSFLKVPQISLLLVGVALLSSCDRGFAPATVNNEVAEMQSGQYTLDKDHASVVFKVNHLGFSTYVGRFNALDAALDFDPEKIEASKLQVIVDMKSIDVNNPKFADDLRGSDWLDTEKFPQAVFKATRFVESKEKNSFKFEGDLTFHGVTAPVTLDVQFHGGGRNFLTRKFTLGFSASTNFKRSAFGADNMTSLGVGDDIELEINAEFQKAKALEKAAVPTTPAS